MLQDFGQEASIEGLGGAEPEGYLVFMALEQVRDAFPDLFARKTMTYQDRLGANVREKHHKIPGVLRSWPRSMGRQTQQSF